MSLVPSSADFELMFELAPISLWLEDLSALKQIFKELRLQGVVDFKAHVAQRPELLVQCSGSFEVLRVNQKTLDLFGASSQAELVSRLSEILRDDTYASMLEELHQLWQGNLHFTNQTVNYALSGVRIDAQINLRVLPGHEATWDRVIVSLQDITTQIAAQKELHKSEQRARSLFDCSPVSLWVDDFGGVKRLFDGLRGRGITDLAAYIAQVPEFVSECYAHTTVLEVNRQTLNLFGADNKDHLVASIPIIFRQELRVAYVAMLNELWQGVAVSPREIIHYKLSGERLHIHMEFSFLPEHEDTWDRVLMSRVDITSRKQTEANLAHMGSHDSLTGLRNRAFYTETLSRICDQGPWPVSVLAIDLNGLKSVNDGAGHAAGDALLVRAAGVLHRATEGYAHCVARIGGDEFVALLPGCDAQQAQTVCAQIEDLTAQDNLTQRLAPLSMAIGIATCQQGGDIEATVHAADTAMFVAKNNFYESRNLDRRRQSAFAPLGN